MGALSIIGKKKSLDRAEIQSKQAPVFANAKSNYRLARFCASAFWSS